MSVTPDFLDSIEEERERRLAGLATPDPHARTLWQRALDLQAAADKALLASAYDFAMAIDYRHEGLASAIYAAHPVRVAAMAVLSNAAPPVETGIVGLLHNVLEVSRLDGDELARRFGRSVRDQIVNLTVDRSRQWDESYKRDYYAALESGSPAARVVKVFDKLDNLYLLGRNPDTAVKTRYVLEVQTHVLPMAARDIPAILPYLTALLNETIVTERLELSPV
jgi:(p)ppGpp synthase/HD superfamily hydrolase